MKEACLALLCAILAAPALAAVPAAPQKAKGPHAALACSACHGAGTQMKKPGTAECLACHGSYEKVAERTAKLNPRFNPHLSHKGAEDCTSCHSMHGKSELICNDCHAFTGAGTDMK